MGLRQACTQGEVASDLCSAQQLVHTQSALSKCSSRTNKTQCMLPAQEYAVACWLMQIVPVLVDSVSLKGLNLSLVQPAWMQDTFDEYYQPTYDKHLQKQNPTKAVQVLHGAH